MAISNEIQYAPLDQLFLDPLNPRLGRAHTGAEVTQERVMELMRDWTLDELAISFLENGYWPQEAVLAVEEELYGERRLVVVEGNRRLAALRYLSQAVNGHPASRKWEEIAAGAAPPANLFERIPYLRVDSRQEVEAFLGFRHVTGIKEWKPAEKAEYIAKLIENSHMTYEQVRRKIGSKTPTVRQNYISYRLFLQMEDREDISLEEVEKKFSVLYLSLRTAGVQQFLQIDIRAEPDAARFPVPEERLEQLARFALWLFGNDETPPLFTDSRLVDKFGEILESNEAVEYLESTDRPNFEVAVRKAGGDEPELTRLINNAANNVQLTLSRVHHYTESENIRAAVERFGIDAFQLFSVFPDIRQRLIAG
jgi:hypothetical protein